VNTSFVKRSAIAIGGAALLLSATIGFSQAQTATSPAATQREAIIDLAAAKLGLTSDQLSTALRQARKDLGVNQGTPQVGKLIHQELSVAATALGLADVKTLRKELAGTTLTAVATKHNVLPSTVAAAMKADVNARIQALVTAGTIKAARGATLKVKAEAKIDTFMTHQFKAAAVSS
jgi:hypothetical protein